MKQWFESNDVLVLKADKSQDSPEVDQLLQELGNSTKAIPYYALIQPGETPVHFDGVYLTPSLFLNELEPGTPQSEKSGQTPVNLPGSGAEKQ